MATQPNKFNETLLDSIDEAITSLFSQKVLDALLSNLKDKRGIAPVDLPDQLPTLHVVLEKYFGLGARTVERAIAHSLYSKLGLQFQRIGDYKLEDYVIAVKTRLK